MQGSLNSPHEVEKHRYKLTTCHWGLVDKKFVSSHLRNWNRNLIKLFHFHAPSQWVMLYCLSAIQLIRWMLYCCQNNAQFQMKLIEFGLSRIIFRSWGVVKSDESCSWTQFTLKLHTHTASVNQIMNNIPQGRVSQVFITIAVCLANYVAPSSYV